MNVLNCMYLISFKATVFSGVYVSTISCNLTTLNGKEQTKLYNMYTIEQNFE